MLLGAIFKNKKLYLFIGHFGLHLFMSENCQVCLVCPSGNILKPKQLFLAPLSATQSLSDRLIVCRRPSTFYIFNFFFKTAGQTALIFGIQVPRDDLIQICSNGDKIYNSVFLRLFMPFLVKKSSSSKPLVRQL